MSVKDQLKQIQEQMNEACERAGRNPDDVHIIAVTKYVSEARTREALEAGITHIGENRVEGGVEKRRAFPNEGTWHFIGSLQSKKVKKMIADFDYLHSLDRLSLAKEIDRRLPDGQALNCFVQVNVSGEQSKSGLKPEEVLPFIEELQTYPGIRVVGLMTMAPFVEDPEDTRGIFRKLRHLRDEVQAKRFDHAPCSELSMGMSNDFIVAIEEGATFVRIGTALVGKEVD
ncbi:YggS family pyridoxal phosphate-dependent enzyme [Halalkalibacterium halodurans]|uniref:YggS family pyridoxal phosphate-dependent enzyme n=1 Tax=Halalkalibacterium halodurans TaxID=86665 RepID=UPI002E1E306D|nr:YggS family pyridoxal phosphate-dependent enzyme [Halalkalibacterium halodurans]MED4079696.1 YggS family pyridoxal phosphate-dependent enzyme [Halalkalibacterium halodurans]MED4086362.1 YggS family pyridoxal phosphate-dependent enzyme [Halalkalibacterium halodurans]MED4103293.1 YggS family pyridoxal phosphate-dependent enzyme [Halalkalibacterium halodurans]MED4108010.1 YggS family pyridoxal phosphate-dependent enzyme [Halalkalibacterium halodurans]MED4148313.1 YggS family pyridoxal phosphat